MSRMTERERLEEVAAELRADGWLVIVEPNVMTLPSELRGLQPDFIASRADELLVGEITSRTSAARQHVNELARRVPLLPNARFVVYWLGDASEEEPAVTAIRKYIGEAAAVSASSPTAGLLLAWAALEAAITRFAVGKELDDRLRMPRQQLSELYSLGYITEADYERLVVLGRIRSEIAHRVSMVEPSRDDIDFVLNMTLRLATGRYVSVDQMVEWFLDNYGKSSQARRIDPHLALAGRFPDAAPQDLDLAVSAVQEQLRDL